MKLKAYWPGALEAARRGDLEPARQARKLDPAGALADYFYGRCLAEADRELSEALALLRSARQAEPHNPLMLHALALALLRTGTFEEAAEAALIWEKHGLPHDLDLLGQVALTLEAQARPWPAVNVAEAVPWPESLPKPSTEPVEPLEPPVSPVPQTDEGESAAAFLSPLPALDRSDEPSDKMSLGSATKSLGFLDRRALTRAVGKMEDWLFAHQPLRVLERAGELLARGQESADLHLVAGLAAEEAGDPARARAHLARAAQLAPAALLARTWLARVYWRSGWVELALALWRSLPVEGPYDYGRHYHLALGHEAAGDRTAALTAMQVALDQFYFDTRHFYIKRALEQWRACRLPSPTDPVKPNTDANRVGPKNA